MDVVKERERFICLSKLVQKVERYDEMVESMKKVANLDVELSVVERNLLSFGYKNVVRSRRASWRILWSIEQNGRVPRVEAMKNMLRRLKCTILF